MQLCRVVYVRRRGLLQQAASPGVVICVWHSGRGLDGWREAGLQSEQLTAQTNTRAHTHTQRHPHTNTSTEKSLHKKIFDHGSISLTRARYSIITDQSYWLGAARSMITDQSYWLGAGAPGEVEYRSAAPPTDWVPGDTAWLSLILGPSSYIPTKRG